MGMIISTLRKEKGMTQAELANLMHVTDKAVSKWERDLSCPDIHTLPKLSACLDISVDDLMQGKQEEKGGMENAGKQFVEVALKAVPMAMGIAVVVLSVLEELVVKDACIMLGIGLACVGISMLRKKE